MSDDWRTLAVLDEEHLRMFTAGDVALEAELFAMFLDNGGRYLAEIEESEDSEARRIAAHSLKGSARGLGFKQVEILAAELERAAANGLPYDADKLAETRSALEAAALAIRAR